MKNFILSSLLVLPLLVSCKREAPPKTVSVPAIVKEERKTLSMDEGWRFHLGDIPFPAIAMKDTYNSTKTGNARGAAAHRFDDTDWRVVNLPHDWVVEGPFDPKANGSQGYRPRGYGWYRKTFQIPAELRGQHLEVQIDGVATYCTVWVNGIEMHQSFSGYTGFKIDLTAIAHFGEEVNTIAVRVDAEKMEGWWYEGGGMYRTTRLVVRPPVHVVTDGVWANPVKAADGSWKIPAEVTVANTGDKPTNATVQLQVLAPDGQVVATQSTTVQVPVLDSVSASLTIPVKQPQLWLVDDPKLYRVETKVITPEGRCDQVSTTCGFRTIRFDAKQGFFLNDQPLKIKGTCNHQDHAGIGVAVPDSVWAFRVRRLKEMGSNAIRFAHNPPSKAWLEECDRQGMLVMDESRIFNVAPEYERQLEWLVRRDRNHPSVILWSVFNEEPMQATVQGYEMVRRLASVVKKLDPTRPVTAAMSGGHFTEKNVSHAVDVVGFNYQQTAYDLFHEKYPDKPIFSSEDTSAYMQRGEYVTDKSKKLIASYDDDASEWGATQQAAWKAIDSRPFVAGAFVWTGFDYRGEPSPYEWPSASSVFGCMDTAGFPKAAYYLRQAMWIKDKPILQIVPHWNWKGREGQPIRVKVITNAPRAELFLNGKSLGEQDVDPYAMVNWQVPYQPGVLEVVAKKDGQEVSRQKVETTGPVARLELIPDRASFKGDGCDTMPITVQAVDAKGQVVPEAAPLVQFKVSGPVKMLGEGNGDSNNHEPEQDGRHTLFHGLAQIILQAGKGSGEAVIQATAVGLPPAEIKVPVLTVTPPESMTASPFVSLMTDWKISPPFATYPDANAKAPIAAGGPKDWRWVQTPTRVENQEVGWTQWRGFFKPFLKSHILKGGVIQFTSVTGKGEFWLNGVKVVEKSDVTPAPVSLPFKPGEVEHKVVVLLQVGSHESVGLTGPVRVESK